MEINKQFNQCPVCGSKKRFLESLVTKIKEQGYARAEWRMGYDFRQGIVIDQAREAIIPLGAKLPTYRIFTDICMDCGTIYATSIESGTATKQIVPPKLIKPGDQGFPFSES